MADVLENILSGHINVNHLFDWLKSNKSDISVLKDVENSEFVPYFLNYMKEKCSWLSRIEKNNEIPVTIKSNFEDSYSLPIKKDVNLIPEKNSASLLQLATQHSKDVSSNKFIPTYKTKDNQKHSNDKESFHRKVQFLTLGCSSYQPKRKEKYSKDGAKQNRLVSLKSTVNNCCGSLAVNNNLITTDLNNLEAFPPLGAKVDDIKAKRRITPTPVQVVNSGSVKFGKSHFEMSSSKVQSDVFQKPQELFQEQRSDLKHERNLLKQTRDQLSKLPTNQSEIKITNIKESKEKIYSEAYLLPDPENISKLEELSVFIEIYSFLLTNYFIPNITSDLYFLFELITTKVTAKDKPKKNDIFCSVHNCVYFAVSVLSKQSQLLYLLDNATLTALLEIPYLIKFSPQLVVYLSQHCKASESSSVLLPSLTRVPFQLDDDSRINFPDDNSFISFKKQRDLFYELLREWQEQPMDAMATKHHEKFARKARQLINLGPSTINMYHFARLFQSQLIASCMCFEVNEVYDEVLSDMQKNFPDKFKKLQERFLTPSQVGGLVPSPSFYGIQSFFAELITATSSPLLNQHLLNIFVCKILEMNNIDILSDDELSSLGTLKDKYIFLLHALRLLGKFLGYLQFLPYSAGQKIPIQVANCHLEARKYEIPPLDLPQLLKTAMKDNHIILTVPWIVEYLSMMDPLAIHLEHVQESLRILIGIYRLNYLPLSDTYSIVFLRLIIGWLIDLLDYPKKYYILLQPMTIQYSEKSSGKGLDTLAIIDKQLIHSCCPYLIEFKVLIFNFLKDMKYKREVRKITPFSTKQPGTSLSSKQQLESELEENFFFLHPVSLKKTSDFIAERVASKVIGKVRSEVTNAKLDIVQEVMNMDKYKSKCVGCLDKYAKQQQILKLLDPLILGMYDDIRYKVHTVIDSACKDVDTLFHVLLPDDTDKAVIEMCAKISFQLAVNKVTEWCDTNLLLDAMKSDIKSKILHLSKSENNDTFETNNISYLSYRMKCISAEIHCKPLKFPKDDISLLCSQIAQIIIEEVPNTLKKTFISLTIDLYIAIVVHFPNECFEELSREFASLWSKCSKDLVFEQLFLCPQNVKFLLIGENFEFSCEKFVDIIRTLLNNEIFSVKNLQSCLEDIKKLYWQDTRLQRALQIFTDVLSA
ncbi:codanin-1 [Trichonephila inaurata madagascariensis]|uniref:Codanin-1 n=1 Tax=Trichonephila inaurata madagascariensis TaxID=2747483 RepID=A0A8X6WUX8_9ARAC|nr:codanin-1 [Trichonephila inaurata madagascariensis]